MTHVYVGMSGGVDSSLTAALLVEQGYQVTGVYMKNWSQDLPGMKCPWAEDLADAKRVAVQLGIDFKVYDFEREYKQKVVDYMVDEYQAGRTPNPDIMCNQEVKFKLFLEAALEDGADMIATGHYARVQCDVLDCTVHHHCVSPASTGDGVSGSDKQCRQAQLIVAADANKDQTYFLYRVTAEALSKTLFPLGGYTKSEVRDMASERSLWTAGKKESMGVCFVGSVGMREFLSQYVQTSPGDIIDRQSGKVIGRHDGAIFYTLGQRHGLDLGGGLPYYVVGKDMARNEVYVSQNIADNNLVRQSAQVHSVHWIAGQPPVEREFLVRLRHRGPLILGTLSGDMLTLSTPERAVTAGQSAVLYSGEVCMGGAIISSFDN